MKIDVFYELPSCKKVEKSRKIVEKRRKIVEKRRKSRKIVCWTYFSVTRTVQFLQILKITLFGNHMCLVTILFHFEHLFVHSIMFYFQFDHEMYHN